MKEKDKTIKGKRMETKTRSHKMVYQLILGSTEISYILKEENTLIIMAKE